ncbi:MAG: hypothetical protein R3E98_17375 [Gemmatimonadota bacterium]|nr:hypothetical protein [Gemmatimonadota bacterium]
MTGIWILSLLIASMTAVLVVGVVRRRRRRRKLQNRRVEAPNSTFTSPLARQREQREHWQGIPLAQLHPLNRKEVERLLAVVAARGVMALSERERVFLDQLAGGRPRDPRSTGFTRLADA